MREDKQHKDDKDSCNLKTDSFEIVRNVKLTLQLFFLKRDLIGPGNGQGASHGAGVWKGDVLTPFVYITGQAN